MNILVIGGAGFIGCNIADYYASQGNLNKTQSTLTAQLSKYNQQRTTDNYHQRGWLTQ